MGMSAYYCSQLTYVYTLKPKPQKTPIRENPKGPKHPANLEALAQGIGGRGRWRRLFRRDAAGGRIARIAWGVGAAGFRVLGF